MTVLGEFVAVWRYIPQLKQFVYAENFNVFLVINLKKGVYLHRNKSQKGVQYGG